MSKEPKKTIKIIYYQTENANRDRNYFLKVPSRNSGVEKYN